MPISFEDVPNWKSTELLQGFFLFGITRKVLRPEGRNNHGKKNFIHLVVSYGALSIISRQRLVALKTVPEFSATLLA